MDIPTPIRPPATRLSFLLSVAGCVLFAAGYAWFLRLHISPYAGGADSSGYLNSAALLRSGRLSVPVPVLPGHAIGDFGSTAHQPLGFVSPFGTGHMVPSYPLGLPLHLAAFSLLVGLDWAAIPLNICSALAGGALLYLLARRLDLPRPLALAGTAVLMLCPLYLFSAVQPMSDLLALVWTLAALYAALRAREGPGWAGFCGLAVALAVLVRPTNLLVVLPVILALGGRWRDFLWVGLGGLPAALLLAWYNRQVYGSPFATGYGDVRSIFSADFLPHNLAHFARWIPGLLTPFVLGALAAPWAPAARRRDFIVLLLWAGLLIGFYSFYYHSGEWWWYLRFILPAFPVLLLAALLGVDALTATLRRREIILGVLLAAGLAWEAVQLSRLEVLPIKQAESTYPEAADWARGHLPGNAAVFCMQVSGALYYYTNFLLVRYELVTPEKMPALLQTLREQHRPVYAILFEFEEPVARQRIGGHWTSLARIRQATIWQIDPAASPP